MSANPIRYKVSIHLDRVMKENGISQTQLAKRSGINHQFIANLRMHKGVANFEKIVTLVNTMNQLGYNVKPSDVISFDVEGKVKVIAHQRNKNRYIFFMKLSLARKTYFDLIQLTVHQDKTKIKIDTQCSDEHKFTDAMRKAIFAQSFRLGDGLVAMIQINEDQKKAIAQELSKIVLEQAIKDKVIKPNTHVNSIDFSYLGTFFATFNNIRFKNSSVKISKDRNDSITGDLDVTYPFLTPSSSRYIEAKNISDSSDN